MFPSDTDLETEVTLQTNAISLPDDETFRILLLGDLSGRENRSYQSNFAASQPLLIDRDNFDYIMKKLNVRLELEFHGNESKILSLSFSELDDFHPDNIFQQLPLFSELHYLRSQLLKPESFEQAAREIRSWFISTENQTNETIQTQISDENNSSVPNNLLDQILSQPGKNQMPTQSHSIVSSELNDFIKKIVQPHLVSTDRAEQSKLLAIIDEITSDFMRKILHHPQFQALESAWRSLYFLVRRMETDINLKLFIFDISKEELSDNFKSVNDITDSILYQLLVTDAPDTLSGEPWSIISGNYNFNLTVADVATLIRLGKISSHVNAPFISSIKPAMLDITSLTTNPGSRIWQISSDAGEIKLWETLRNTPEAEYIGLAIPRFLIRLPYGQASEPIETFSFEELTSFDDSNQYLWANPTFACILLLGQSFSDNGWEMEKALHTKIDNLPTYIYQEYGETKTIPCTEFILTENSCNLILEQGLMPLISFRNSDSVQLARFQSIAYPLKKLTGRWSV